MIDVTDLKTQAQGQISGATTLDALEQVRVTLLGKKGLISAELKKMGGMSPEERQTTGAALNRLKSEVTDSISIAKNTLEFKKIIKKKPGVSPLTGVFTVR